MTGVRAPAPVRARARIDDAGSTVRPQPSVPVVAPPTDRKAWAATAVSTHRPRVAIVHEWLATYAGSERVVEQILQVYPDADLFAVLDVLPEADRGFLSGRQVRTTFVQRLPWLRRMYRWYLPVMPFAIEQLDLRAYDIVISSSHAVAKGVLIGPNQLHVCYCHTPMRYAWDLQGEYVGGGLRSLLTKPILHYLRMWDTRSALGVDHFFANSRYIARRIRACYRREATVVYPPVDTSAFPLRTEKGDYYVAGSRLVPYKRMDVIIEAFGAMPGRRLVVVGDGPESGALRRAAAGMPNVEFVGHVPHARLVDLLQGARAFVFAAEEDFGILPVEAQCCGTPVIAYGQGGARESIVDGVTGVLFHERTADAVCAAVLKFEASPRIQPRACRRNAERFSTDRFRTQLAQLVSVAWLRFASDLGTSPEAAPDPEADGIGSLAAGDGLARHA